MIFPGNRGVGCLGIRATLYPMNLRRTQAASDERSETARPPSSSECNQRKMEPGCDMMRKCNMHFQSPQRESMGGPKFRAPCWTQLTGFGASCAASLSRCSETPHPRFCNSTTCISTGHAFQPWRTTQNANYLRCIRALLISEVSEQPIEGHRPARSRGQTWCRRHFKILIAVVKAWNGVDSCINPVNFVTAAGSSLQQPALVFSVRKQMPL